VVRLMQAVSEVFHEHGGHHFSGGFSVRDEHIHTFGERLNEALTALGEAAAIVEEVEIDEVLTLDTVNLSLVKDINQLAPFGVANPKPLFAFVDVTPRKVEQFGKAGEHLKLIFETISGTLEAISFFATPESFSKQPEAASPCTLIAHVEQSYFMNRPQIRLRIVDIV
jgi:single-stranded-DNA-specific exonuclease